MANTILITANWHTGALSQQTISRQYDNNRYAVRFVGYPEASDDNELDYYLLVWMSTAPGQKPGEITPIQLNSDQWYISNYFTQQVQVIKFQLCVLNEAGTYEAHSPIFSGRIGDSLEHDGTSQDIDVSTLFDAYRKYIEELIIGAGAVIIDPVPTQGSTNAVSSGGVYEALHDTDTTLSQSGQAADAKVVGDKIADIKSNSTVLSNMQPHVYDLTWEQGGIDSTGAEYYQNTHIRSNSIDVSDFDNVKVIYPAGYRGYICTISNGVFNRSGIAAGATVNLDITNVQSMRFDVTNGSPISVDIGEGVAVSSVYGIVTYINRLNENIADNITDLYSATSESGKYINGNNGNIGSDPTYSIRTIDCSNQTKLIINPNFTHTSLGYGFYDDSNAVKGYGKFTDPIGTYYVIDVPSGATKFTFTATLNAVSHPLLKVFEDMNDVKQQIDALKVDTSKPLANTGLVPPSFITMFKKIVHIGDSLTRGQTDTTSPISSGADIPDYSRPVMMGRMIGNENLNLGLGGRTASNQYMNSAGYSKGWYINATGGTAYTDLFTPADFLENPGDCYIIALGTNDISAGGFTGDVSTDINDADFTQNANTSVGGYAMIIQQIKAIQPKAKIFCVTIPHSRNTNAVALRTEANQKITDIVNHFDNCYLIDLYTYAEQSADGEFATYYKNATHNNCLGYMKRAQQYIAYIDWIILNNLSDFRNVNFIGTNYDFVP